MELDEPLKNLLIIYSDSNKQEVLLNYLPNETTNKLRNHEYVIDLETLFLNDRLITINKQTGKIYKIGSVIKITEECITIKDKNSQNNLTLHTNDYYLFRYLRINKSKKDNRKFVRKVLALDLRGLL